MAEFVARALGQCDNIKSTNSMEALKNSYNKGFKKYEVDVYLSLDGELLCVNGFKPSDYTRMGIPYDEEKPCLTSLEFKSKKLFSRYTPCDIKDIFEFMKGKDDINLFIDIHNLEKGDSYKTVTILSECMDKMAINKSSIKIMVYSDEMVYEIKRVIPDVELCYYIEKERFDDISYVISNCKKEKINLIGLGIEDVPSEEMKDKILNCVSKINEEKMNSFINPVNDVDFVNKLEEKGVTYINTDYLLKDADGNVFSTYEENMYMDYGLSVGDMYFPPEEVPVYYEGEVCMIKAKILSDAFEEIRYLYSASPSYKVVLTNTTTGESNIYTRFSDVYGVCGEKRKAPFICRTLNKRIYVPMETVNNLVNFTTDKTLKVIKNVH